MTAPDRDAIRAALRAVRVPCPCGECDGDAGLLLMAHEADYIAPTVATLMEDYAADPRAEVERLRVERDRALSDAQVARTRAASWSEDYAHATADRDAYAAEKVRAALLDAAAAIEAERVGLETNPPKLALTLAARIVRDRAGAS